MSSNLLHYVLSINTILAVNGSLSWFMATEVESGYKTPYGFVMGKNVMTR